MKSSISNKFKNVQIPVGRKEGEISPNNVDDGAGISSGGSGEGKRGVCKKRRVDSELHYQERETMIWADKLKSMGPSALGDIERGGVGTEEGVVVTEMSNVKVIKGMAETTSKAPVKEVSPEIKALRDRDNNRGRMVRVVRHTLGRRDSCQW